MILSHVHYHGQFSQTILKKKKSLSNTYDFISMKIKYMENRTSFRNTNILGKIIKRSKGTVGITVVFADTLYF